MAMLGNVSPSSNTSPSLCIDSAAPNTWPVVLANPASECEIAVLGSVLCRNERYWECVEDGLEAEHFAHQFHATLWRAMAGQIAAGLDASPVTLRAMFGGDPQLEQLGGAASLVRLASQSAGIVNVVSYARAVREWAQRRTLAQLGAWLQAQALSGGNDLAQVVADANLALDDCQPTARRAGPMTLAQAVALAQESHERARLRGAIDGVPFGLQALDRLIGGAAKSDLVILAGRPGMGKSALASHIALHNARAGKTVVFFSLEMTAEQLASRTLADAAEVDGAGLRRGAVNAAQVERLRATAHTLDLPLIIDETGAIDTQHMRALLRRARTRNPLGLCVVDYVQLMSSRRPAENRVQELTAITADLKKLAKEFGIPILVLSQLNRGLEAREDKRPLLSDLRDSGSIEQDADAVIFLYREDYYLKQEEPKDEQGDAHARWRERRARCTGKADLIVAKNRHGPCDTVQVGFAERFTRFLDLA